ncbi:MAG: type II toxin-antitoxin system HicB family antitoxin [Planctomycetes bacterium]|uniref:type II toxin-antitoxin system HicB family antitoxin n=1 Tax=Candidatus Wunengus sp. YC65 TaxID=3367701 RepID=UPI001DB16E4B|nr:type II toxin-antitoxin system HicB family antitoxin [Planctomycetota bacterium]
MKTFTIEIEKDGKFYIAQCREHSNCFTQAKTIEETIHNIKEVLELMLEIRHPRIKVILKDKLVNIL